MEILTIKYFLSLAQCLNFSAAAEENNISQSSFSKAIMRLERELDVKLIDRSRHPISLTPAGECFYRRMLALQPQFQEAVDELASFTDRNVLRILICPRSFQYKMALDEFLQQEKGVQLEIGETSDISQVTEQLQSGKYDFVITPRPFDLTDDVRAFTLYDDSLYILVSSSSPLAEQDCVSLKELDGQNFLEGVYSKLLVNELSRRFHFTPGTVFPLEGKRMTRQEALYRIAKGLGVGIYPGRDLRPFRNIHMVCLPIQEIPDFPVMLLEPAGARETLAKQRFRRWITENLEKYVPGQLNVEKFNHFVRQA